MRDTAILAGVLVAMVMAILAGVVAYTALVSMPVCSSETPEIIIDVHGAAEDDIEIYTPSEELAPIVDII